MITILGAGAIGGVLAHALLTQHTSTIQLIARTPFRGLRVHDPNDLIHTYDISTTPLEHAVRASWLFVATKAHQTQHLGDALARLVGPKTVVFVFQNGVEHRERLKPLLPFDVPIFPAMIDAPVSKHTDNTGCRHVHIRRHPIAMLEDTSTQSDITTTLCDALSSEVITCETTDDLRSTLWRKLCLNVISGAIPTLTDSPGHVFQHPQAQHLCRMMVREAIMVGRACGAILPNTLEDEIIAERARSNPATITSMLQDRRAGRALEVDARNGAICRLGVLHGIATPYNEMATALLHVISDSSNAS